MNRSPFIEFPRVERKPGTFRKTPRPGTTHGRPAQAGDAADQAPAGPSRARRGRHEQGRPGEDEAGSGTDGPS